jgi:hypothetical protein
LATLNVNIPRFYCFLRKEFLYDGLSHQGEFINVCVFAATSIRGRAIGFHAITDNGAVIWRLPIHAFCHKADAPETPLDWLQFWDCFSYEVSAEVFDQLRESRVRVQIKDRSWEGGQYMFTIDWYGSEDAEEAGDGGHKCAHMIALDNGNFAAQPNNRIQWLCPAFITPFQEKPDYLTNTRIGKVERETETSQPYFYDTVGAAPRTAQVALYAKGLRSDDEPVLAEKRSRK